MHMFKYENEGCVGVEDSGRFLCPHDMLVQGLQEVDKRDWRCNVRLRCT